MVLFLEWSYFWSGLVFGMVLFRVVILWSGLIFGVVLFLSGLNFGVVLFWSGLILEWS